MTLFGARLLVRIDPETLDALKGTVEPISIPFPSGEGGIVPGASIPLYNPLSGTLPYGPPRLISGEVISVGQLPKQTQTFSDGRPQFEDDDSESFDPNPLPDQLNRLMEIGMRLIRGQNFDVELPVFEGDRIVFNVLSADRWPEGDNLVVVNNNAVVGKLDDPATAPDP